MGVIPLGPWVAPGVAAGVAGVTPFPLAAGWPFMPGRWLASAALPGGVNSLEPPGKDSEPGAVNALACAALDGCVWMLSMIAVDNTNAGVSKTMDAEQNYRGAS